MYCVLVQLSCVDFEVPFSGHSTLSTQTAASTESGMGSRSLRNGLLRNEIALDAEGCVRHLDGLPSVLDAAGEGADRVDVLGNGDEPE